MERDLQEQEISIVNAELLDRRPQCFATNRAQAQAALDAFEPELEDAPEPEEVRFNPILIRF